MRKLRVLVVDDSVVARRVLVRALSSDPAIEVVGTAPNGRIALVKIAQARPDLVTLDVEMPEMGGLETLAVLRKTNPLLPVIMFSVFTKEGSRVTRNALDFGGVDFVTKPTLGEGIEAASKVIREDLVPRIKTHLPLAAVPVTATDATRAASAVPGAAQDESQPAPRVDIVVVGASTGGPRALEVFLSGFPVDFPAPILIVQHMPQPFTKLLANRLAAKSRIHVAEAHGNQTLVPGHAWLAPGGNHMTVESGDRDVRIRISQEPPENSCRPSVDVLFRSAAIVFGPHVLAVMMTGMGQDGFRGCQAIRAAGGRILAQDESSSVVWGMPGFVAQSGLVDRIVPLHELAAEVLARVASHAAAQSRMRSKRRSG